HDHAVVGDGPWYDPTSCWFNGLYTRVVPSHAIEMTAALLDRRVANMLARSAATLEQKQDLAAVIHLCGPARGGAYARGGFQSAGQRCGAHDLAGYLAQVNALKRLFVRLAGADRTGGTRYRFRSYAATRGGAPAGNTRVRLCARRCARPARFT